MKTGLRLGLTLLIAGSLILLVPAHNIGTALAASGPSVSLNVDNTGPRQVEDTTQRAEARDYAAAWQSMADALNHNQPDVASANFVGSAADRLTETIKDQRRNGLHQQIVDKGHKVEAVFYSPEGSAIELHDTAKLQIEVLDGDKLVHSEDATVHYVALLTAAENSWKIRVLQAVPSF